MVLPLGAQPHERLSMVCVSMEPRRKSSIKGTSNAKLAFTIEVHKLKIHNPSISQIIQFVKNYTNDKRESHVLESIVRTLPSDFVIFFLG